MTTAPAEPTMDLDSLLLIATDIEIPCDMGRRFGVRDGEPECPRGRCVVRERPFLRRITAAHTDLRRAPNRHRTRRQTGRRRQRTMLLRLVPYADPHKLRRHLEREEDMKKLLYIAHSFADLLEAANVLSRAVGGNEKAIMSMKLLARYFDAGGTMEGLTTLVRAEAAFGSTFGDQEPFCALPESLSEQEQAAIAVCRAWTIAGPAPFHHATMRQRLKKEWPTLTAAIYDLEAVTTYDEGEQPK